MIVFALISLLMFLIAILLYRLDKRQLISCKVAVAAGYIAIAYFMGLGSVPSIHIINGFIVMSMMVCLVVVLLLTYLAVQKDIFTDYQEKKNYQKISGLASVYLGLLLLVLAYIPGIFGVAASHEIKALLGSLLLYAVWNALSYLLHILIFPKHIIREYPSYILMTDLYDESKSIAIAKNIYQLYQETAIIMVGTSEEQHRLFHLAKEEFPSTTAMVQLFYDGTAKDLLSETKEVLYDLDIVDEGLIVSSEEDYLRLGLMAKQANLESDIAIILDEVPNNKVQAIYNQLWQIINCFSYEYFYHSMAISLIIILNIFF